VQFKSYEYAQEVYRDFRECYPRATESFITIFNVNHNTIPLLSCKINQFWEAYKASIQMIDEYEERKGLDFNWPEVSQMVIKVLLGKYHKTCLVVKTISKESTKNN